MNKEKALDILKANVYCSDSRLRCGDCPLYTENKEQDNCKGFNDDDLYEAVKALNG